jgi:hypothetical protein
MFIKQASLAVQRPKQNDFPISSECVEINVPVSEIAPSQNKLLKKIQNYTGLTKILLIHSQPELKHSTIPIIKKHHLMTKFHPIILEI